MKINDALRQISFARRDTSPQKRKFTERMFLVKSLTHLTIVIVIIMMMILIIKRNLVIAKYE